jgi:hypothetical protein
MAKKMGTFIDVTSKKPNMPASLNGFLSPHATCVMLSLLLWSGCQRSLAQQNKPVPVEIEKKDATVVKGKLLGIARDSVRIVDEYNQELRISLRDIRNIDYIDSMRVNKRWNEAPNTLRYFLAPTAIPLRKKEIVFQATDIAILSAHYGLSNRVTIGGGVEPFSGGTYFLNAKVNILSQPKFKFSMGGSYFGLPANFITTTSGDDVRGFGMLFGAGTWGNANNHLTVGTGYMYVLGSFLPPLVTVSGTVRFARNFAFVTENWFFFVGSKIDDLPPLVSLGLRYINKRSSLDLSFYSDYQFSSDVILPHFGYTIKLGKR